MRTWHPGGGRKTTVSVLLEAEEQDALCVVLEAGLEVLVESIRAFDPLGGTPDLPREELKAYIVGDELLRRLSDETPARAT
jgi:hypothetical protein